MEDEVLLEEGYDSSDKSKGAYDSDNYMEKYMISQDTEIIEGKRQAEEVQLADDEDEYSGDESDEEEQLHRPVSETEFESEEDEDSSSSFEQSLVTVESTFPS